MVGLYIARLLQTLKTEQAENDFLRKALVKSNDLLKRAEHILKEDRALLDAHHNVSGQLTVDDWGRPCRICEAVQVP